MWGGVVRTEDELQALASRDEKFSSHAICVGDGFYLTWDPSGVDATELFNHSCSPNLGVKGQIVVVTRRAIQPGEELTFDYDTTETTPQPWPCRCGSPACRGTIDGKGWDDPAFLRANRGYLAWHIEERARRAGHLPDDASDEGAPC
ncbi:MAG: SET domain-containing protein-lysine N-methyltransferase [Phycisphaerales bacterium]|nr:SET domain-containing protein-lysine N-methyltransferase [Phycisphaerales bacterium]